MLAAMLAAVLAGAEGEMQLNRYIVSDKNFRARYDANNPSPCSGPNGSDLKRRPPVHGAS